MKPELGRNETWVILGINVKMKTDERKFLPIKWEDKYEVRMSRYDPHRENHDVVFYIDVHQIQIATKAFLQCNVG